MSSGLLVFVERVTPRVSYIFNELLGNRLGLEVAFTDDNQRFEQHIGAKLSYGKEAVGNALHFDCHDLLFETGIAPLEVDVRRDGLGRVHLFSGKDDRSALPFDLFAASFYLLTRYEEHLPHSTDRFGRFDATQSMAFKHGFLKEPVVDQWTLLIRDVLQRHFPELTLKCPVYSFTSTIDIDNAFAYLHKGMARNAGGLLRDMLKGKFADVPARFRTLLGMQADPYDTYIYLKDTHLNAKVDSIYFFLIADRSEHDKNLSHTHPAFRTLIADIAAKTKVGIHPGFRSNAVEGLTALEKSRLEEIIGTSVTRSRQHFIMLSFPDTYRTLIEAGIAEDHSMGYASHLGFRAGTSVPYYYYDLTTEQETGLLVFPFCCMDGTLRHYLALSPETAMREVDALVREVRAVGGHFISIWHNETVRDSGEWKGWRAVFEHTLKVAASH